jgi:hypothetical protein
MQIERRRLHRWLGAALGAALLNGCGGDDDASSTPVGPTGPVTLKIEGFSNNQGQRFDRDDEQVTLSCGGGINVRLGPRASGGLTNWLLRPPGACGSFRQCGYVALSLTQAGSNDKILVSAATTTISVPAAIGRHGIVARLLTDIGEPFLQEQEPVSDSLEQVQFVPAEDCAGTGQSGTGGSGSGGMGSGGMGTAGLAGASFGGEAGMAGAGGQDQG